VPDKLSWYIRFEHDVYPWSKKTLGILINVGWNTIKETTAVQFGLKLIIYQAVASIWGLSWTQQVGRSPVTNRVNSFRSPGWSFTWLVVHLLPNGWTGRSPGWSFTCYQPGEQVVHLVGRSPVTNRVNRSFTWLVVHLVGRSPAERPIGWTITAAFTCWENKRVNGITLGWNAWVCDVTLLTIVHLLRDQSGER
jgi:hypothetical protein